MKKVIFFLCSISCLALVVYSYLHAGHSQFAEASLVLTLMQSLRGRYQDDGLDKNEYRRSRYGALEFYREQTNRANSIASDQIKDMVAKSMGNTIQIPVMDARDVTITNVRSCTVPDEENTSRLVTLTFVTYAWGFTMFPAQYFNNQIKYQTDFDAKLEPYLQKFAAILDSACINNLSINKNQYFPADMAAFYPSVGNSLQVTQAQKNDFYNQLEAIQATRDYYGRTNIISSTTGMPMINRLAAQGGGNAVNEAFQLGGYEWHYTNRLTNGAGIQATLYAVQDGYVAMLNRNDPDALMGSSVGNGLKQWGIANVPLVNLDMATYYYEDCADRSALHAGTAHLTRTKLEGYEWSTDICYINSYNSSPATKYNPILKAEISAS